MGGGGGDESQGLKKKPIQYWYDTIALNTYP